KKKGRKNISRKSASCKSWVSVDHHVNPPLRTLNFDYQTWAMGKEFHVGDKLTRKSQYVDELGFKQCSTTASLGSALTSGNDIWGLVVGKKTEMLATGSGDAVISLWHDSTEVDKEEAFRKEATKVVMIYN
ncbi:hypothetical protein Leryth_018301, partial [Lithospermum erythrorhizon]